MMGQDTNHRCPPLRLRADFGYNLAGVDDIKKRNRRQSTQERMHAGLSNARAQPSASPSSHERRRLHQRLYDVGPDLLTHCYPVTRREAVMEAGPDASLRDFINKGFKLDPVVLDARRSWAGQAQFRNVVV